MAAWTVLPSSPTDNLTGVSINPTFTWIKTDLGDPEPRVKLTIADNVGLLKPFLEILFSNGEEFYDLKKITLDNITDYWWAVSIEETAPSVVWKFTTLNLSPTLTSPINGASDVILQPTLYWKSNDGSTQFDLQLSENSDFSGAEGVDLWTYDDIVAEEYTLTSNLPISTVIYWRVRVTDGVNDGPWTDGGDSFTSTAGTPGISILGLPTDADAEVSLNELFTWDEGSAATSYDIYFDTDSGFSDPKIFTTKELEYRAEDGLFLNSTTYYWKVVTNNNSGSTDSATRSFITISPTVPEKPIPSTPEGLISTNLPVLVWSIPIKDLTFQIQVASDIGFTNIVEEELNITSSSYQTIVELDNTTEYFWRVKAINDSVGGEWSNILSFETPASTGPSTPIWVNPLNNAVEVPLEVVLEWSDTTNTNWWVLQVFNSSGSMVISTNLPYSGGPTYTVPAGIFASGEVYTAIVKSADSITQRSYSASATIDFTTTAPFENSFPELTVPTQQQTEVSQNPTIQWGYSLAGVGITYHIQVSESADMNNPIISIDGITPLEQAIDLSAFQGPEFWVRVRAEKVSGNTRSTDAVLDEGSGSSTTQVSLWSVLHQFTTEVSVAPAVPVIIFPENGSVNVAMPVFCFWTTSPTTTDYYQLEVSLFSSFASIIYRGDNLNGLQNYIEDLDFDTVYYIRVRGFSASYEGGWGVWSSTNMFTTEDSVLPGDITLVTPIRLAENISLTPLFEWTPSQSALYYVLEIYIKAGLSWVTIYRSNNLAVTNLTLPSGSALDSQTHYNWRVRGENANGNGNWAYSDFYTTNAVLPQIPILITPANFSGGSSRSPKFTWKEDGITSAVKYTLEIALNKGFTSGVTQIENIPILFLDLENIYGDVVTYVPLEYYNRYYWRVRGVNASLSNGEWSDIFTFVVVDIPAPLKTIITTPTYLEEVTKVSTIYFESALFATFHNVQVSEDPTFRDPIINENVAEYTSSLEVTLSYAKTYYIRVQGIGRGGFGEYSEDLKITVESAP